MADTKICILAVYKALLDAKDKLSMADLMNICDKEYNSHYTRKSLKDTLYAIEIVDARLRHEIIKSQDHKKLYWIERGE